MSLLLKCRCTNTFTWKYTRLFYSILKNDGVTPTESLEPENGNVNPVSRGKKLKPQKPNIVVLDLKQSGLLPTDRRHHYNNKTVNFPNRSGHGNDNKIISDTLHHHHHHPNRITLLEGVDLGDPDVSECNKHTQNNHHNISYLADFKTQNPANLLQFKSKLTKEQIIQSIDSMKPPTTEVSNKLFNELLRKLFDGYTVKQLRYYISMKSDKKLSTSKMVKLDLVKRLLHDLWQLAVSSNINSRLTGYSMSYKTINLNDVQTKLLLLTQNGKILKNLSRLDKNLLIQLDYSNNQLKLWGDESVLKYIEISINNILKNILMTKWLPSTTSSPTDNSNLIVSRITRLCDVDIDLDKNEIFAFGNKRIQLAKRLLLWAEYLNMELSKPSSNYWKQSIDQIISNDSKGKQFQWFPFVDIQTLNWLRQIEPYATLREICSIQDGSNKQLSSDSSSMQKHVLLTDEQINKFYDFFHYTDKMSFTDTHPNLSNILSISLGQILRTNINSVLTSSKLSSSPQNWIFHPRVPQLSQRLSKMSILDEQITKDELLTTDQHDYYLQIILTPDRTQFEEPVNDVSILKNRPLELWLQLDENNQIILDSVQAIIPMLRENYLIQTPELQFDYRISNDYVMNIPVILKSQPGLILFLNEIKMNNTIDNIKVPSTLDLISPLVPSSNIKPSLPKIGYNYVTCNRHKILKLKYMDKYCVQYSEIDGGNFGGKSQQIDFISNDSKPTREEFHTFIKDIFKF